MLARYTYWDKDGLSGYSPGEGEFIDQPVRSAMVRNGSMLAFSNAAGKYAMLDYHVSDNCLYGSPMTAMHPLTGKVVQVNGLYKCSEPYIISDFNIKLADKDEKFPDNRQPTVSLDLKIVTGQEDRSFAAGTIQLDTNMELKISVVDEEISSVSLKVERKTADMASADTYTANLSQTGTPVDVPPAPGEESRAKKYTYRTFFAEAITGSQPYYFNPKLIGTYTFTVTATDAAGNESVRTLRVRAVEAGEIPGSVPGPPRVDEIIPNNDATGIMVTMPMTVTFSENVENINADNLYLEMYPEVIDKDETPDQEIDWVKVDSFVYHQIEGGRKKGVIQPKHNLFYGRYYRVTATTGIIDNDGDALAEEGNIATFRTKDPHIYDLDEGSFSEGRDIALFSSGGGKTWAFIAAGTEGWHVADVTDPTRPVIVYSHRPSPQFSFRGVAIDETTNTLAVTDSVSIYGGGQFGYVRFYNIGDPASPVYEGQERLAENWSGMPGRVAIYKGHAYVSTVMTGLHVVDITKARDYKKETRGMSVTYLMDTNGLGYGQPGDINVFSNKAVLTTSKGYLVVLDLTVPSYPQELGHKTPTDTYDAFRAAAVEGYNYTDDEGLTQVMDLAVTGSRTGGINTVDLTNPYTPIPIGTVKNEDGTDFKAFASDIAISENSGLAFITSMGAIYVIDIKDPRNPIMLNKIDAAPVGEGGVIDELLGEVKALVEKDGWVYLASTDGGLRVLDLDPVYLKYYCDDAEFITNISCKDFYPALANSTNGGKKTIILEGRDWAYSLLNKDDPDGKARVKLLNVTPAGVTVTSENNETCPNSNEKCVIFKDGYARFYVQTNQNFVSDEIKLEFEIDMSSISGFMNNLLSDVTNLNRATIELKVRHNGNIKVGDVLNESAVYVYDTDRNHALSQCNGTGSCQESENELEKGFAYVKELLNQVMPRKRSVTGYTFIEEDGYFDEPTFRAISSFKVNFGMGGAKVDGDKNISIGNTNANLEYENNNFKDYNADDDTTDIFRKLMKDYNLRTNSGDWLNKIVDKALLVGNEIKVKRISSGDGDTLINDGITEVANARDDTGLYELYKNVVLSFVDTMIAEGQRYVDDTTPFRDRNGRPQTGVSYSYGSSEILNEYHETATAQVSVPNLIPDDYMGNLGGVNEGKQYAGLKRNELNVWKDGHFLAGNVPYDPNGGAYTVAFNNVDEHKFYPDHWAGIDCSGFVQIMINAADPEISASGLVGVDIESIPRIRLNPEVDSQPRQRSTRAYNNTFFNEINWNEPIPPNGRISYVERIPARGPGKVETLKKLRKGDMLKYGGHVSMVYSDRPNCTNNDCTYEIIHASGSLCLDIDRDGSCANDEPFNRKVVTNSTQHYRTRPIGFGRIKLWD